MNNGKKIKIKIIMTILLIFFALPSASYGDAVTDLVSNETPEKIRNFFLTSPDLDVNKVYPGGETLLMYAAANNPNSAVIHLLASRGARINAKDEAGLTPLMFAVTTNKNLGATFALLQLGADPELTDPEGVSALMYAARDAAPPIMETLLSKGPDVNRAAINGWTPLMFAVVGNSDIRVAELLLENGAQINDVNSNGMTPLMLASRCASNPDIVELLLRYSADTTIRSEWGMAADFARANPKLRNSAALRNLETTTRLRISEMRLTGR